MQEGILWLEDLLCKEWAEKLFSNQVICPRAQMLQRHQEQTSKYGLSVEQTWGQTHNSVEALDYFKQEFGVHIEQTKMWRAMKEAKQLVEGSERKQYAKVFDYAHELLRSNLRSTIKINTIPSPEGPPQFQKLYICLDGRKKDFVARCRLFIDLNRCFLKSVCRGNLLSTLGFMPTTTSFLLLMLWWMLRTKTIGNGS